jgi:anti-anti-sigma factor
MSRFRIETFIGPGYAVLRAEGEVDAAAAHALEEECDRLADAGSRSFIFNFARAGIIESRGLAILLGMLERFGEAERGRLLLCELGEVNAELIEAVGLPPGAGVAATEAEARALLEETPVPPASFSL